MNRQINILIIEDDQDTRNVIRFALAQDYRQIQEASNADEALHLLESESPEIILLDIHLKGSIDGLSLYERIAADIRFRKTRVVIISGARSTELIEKARNLGVAVYLEKPFSPEKLDALVRSLESREMFIVPPVNDDKKNFSYDELLDW
jgi:DNA-binding response OmpR family regulator